MTILRTFRWFSLQDIVVSIHLSIIYFRKQFLRVGTTIINSLCWFLVATLSFGRACWWGWLVEHWFIVELLVVYSAIFRFNRLLDSRKILHTFSHICRCCVFIFVGWTNSTVISFLRGLHGLFLFYLAVRFGENRPLLGSLDAFWGQCEAGFLLLISFNDTSQSEKRTVVARHVKFGTRSLVWVNLLAL